MEQLIQKDCETGEYKNIFPITSLASIKDLETGETLDEIIGRYNHLYLEYINNSKGNTRLQVPVKFRKKGLWISYVSCNNEVVTEYYNSDDFSNKAWADSKNWVNYMNQDIIRSIVLSYLSWYKA